MQIKYLSPLMAALTLFGFGSGYLTLPCRCMADRSALPPSLSLTGSYVRSDGSYLDVIQQNRSTIRFYLYVSWGKQFGWHSGVAFGEAKVKNHTALYHAGEGVLTFRFAPDRIVVKQKGTSLDCEFGANVNANGDYLRHSERSPVGSEHGGGRLEFNPGCSAVIYDGQVALAPHDYRWTVHAGEQWKIKLEVDQDSANARLIGPRKQRLTTIAAGSTWMGVFPRTEEVILRVIPQQGVPLYGLEVERKRPAWQRANRPPSAGHEVRSQSG